MSPQPPASTPEKPRAARSDARDGPAADPDRPPSTAEPEPGVEAGHDAGGETGAATGEERVRETADDTRDAPSTPADAAPPDPAPPPWRYEASARGPRAVIVLGLWWGLIGLGLVLIDLSPWIAGVLAVFTLPALWELIRGATAWIEIAPGGIAWGSGTREGFVARGEIDRLRFDTRLDFSLRLTIVTVGVSRIRLPYECLPRAARLKAALDAHGYPHEHHHFALMS